MSEEKKDLKNNENTQEEEINTDEELFDEEIEDLEEIDEESDESEEEEDDKKEESVPLSKFLETKNQLKEYKKKAAQYEEKELDNSMLKKKESIIKKWKAKGYDDDFAEAMAEDIISVMADNINIKKQSSFESTINEELEDLSNSDPFFSDAKSYKKDISKYMQKMKKKDVDITLEEAYMHVRGVKGRLKEVRTDIEQRNLYSKQKKSQKAVSNSNSSAVKDTYKLDKNDREALRGLKKAQPDKNWTEEKYFKMMKKNKK